AAAFGYEDHVMWNNRGVALDGLGRHEDAIQAYTRAMQRNSAYEIAAYNLGNAFAQLGQFDEALVAYDRALAINPSYPDALYDKALVLARLGRTKPLLFHASSLFGFAAIARSYASTASSYRSRAYSESPSPVHASASCGLAVVAALYASTASSNLFSSSRSCPLRVHATTFAASVRRRTSYAWSAGFVRPRRASTSALSYKAAGGVRFNGKAAAVSAKAP